MKIHRFGLLMLAACAVLGGSLLTGCSSKSDSGGGDAPAPKMGGGDSKMSGDKMSSDTKMDKTK